MKEKWNTWISGLKQKDARCWAILLIMLLAVVVCICVVVYFVKQHKGGEKQEEAQKIAQVSEEENKLDWDKLREMNKDIYAWIYIPGTKVNYPVLQSDEYTDTDYYLDHNLDGTQGLPGCIYTQKLNQKNFEDRVTVIYGHDMRDGSMFRTLHDYKDRSFFDKNQYIYIYTPEYSYTYQIYAAYRSDDSLILGVHGLFQDEAEYVSFLQDVTAMEETDEWCHINRETEVSAEDKTIILSTCVSDPQHRYLIQAKQVSVTANE